MVRKGMQDRKTVLCITALPPPITGVSVASEAIISHLKKRYCVDVVNYARGNLVSGTFSLRQFLNIISQGLRIIKLKGKAEYVYLAISSTFWGNLRDLFFLFLLGKEKRKNTVLHLHTGVLDRYLSSCPNWVKILNRKLLGDVKAAIVLGESHAHAFGQYLSQDKVKITKNGVGRELFIPEELLMKKYGKIEKINLLYLSNLMPEKGYEVLLDAYLSLSSNLREKTVLHFAGYFYDEFKKEKFLNTIKKEPNIFYHGPVSGGEKARLLRDAHIYCFPSYYYYEAQPIGILEAYASGCIVLTTNHGGIRDIFQDKVNGIWVEPRDIEGLRKNLELLILNIDKYKGYGFFNRRECAPKYTIERCCQEVEEVINL